MPLLYLDKVQHIYMYTCPMKDNNSLNSYIVTKEPEIHSCSIPLLSLTIALYKT